ncbi:MAG: zinc-dependent metalloprotease [Flammeovirgaceae bacterium]
MNKLVRILLIVALGSFVLSPAYAQKKKKKKGKKGAVEEVKKPMAKKPKKPKSKIKSIKELTKKCKTYEGLFTLYQDTTSGATYMQISKEQIGKEFIYFSMITDGPLIAGQFRGAYQSNAIFSVQKYFDRIELVVENTSFYFDEDNALSKAADANISKAIFLSAKIAAQDSLKENFVIKSDGLFKSEKMTMVNFTYLNPLGFKLGRMSRDKTKYKEIRNYPENTDVVMEYVYDNPNPRNFGGPGITDPRYVSVGIQHSFIQVPENNFKPRWDDPRLGYFGQQVNDMTATDATPYRDVINRWHLEKKDKNAALSEPVEPITWWIENTTPVEFRDAIKKGVLAWNKAFEKAGFKNAVEVKVQPDDADWDGGDIRYNVLRWTSSPIRAFRGYGPSFTNPRTGQIIGADVMLEYALFRIVVQEGNVFDRAALGFDKYFQASTELAHNPIHHKNLGHTCSAGEMLKDDFHFADQFLRFEGKGVAEKKRMQEELIMWVVMHEVGHTLGLMHNMKASQLHAPDQLNDMERTGKMGLIGSVMDYPTVNLAPKGTTQGHYYSTAVGPYDDWVIEYGYTPDLSDEDLKKIAARSTDPTLAFGNDADDMRAPGKAIDPRVNIWDLSNDAVGYSTGRMDLVLDMIKNLKEKQSKDGESYQELRSAYNILFGQYLLSAGVISRYVGGVYIDRAFQGQEGGTKPFTPVPLAYQKKAMDALSKYVFAPDAYDVPNELYNYLQMQRRGYNFFSAPEDFRVHNAVAAMQNNVLVHILHPNTLQRIVDTEKYGNEYKLDQFMTDLNDAIFKADAYGNVNTFRQNLQLNYTRMLSNMIIGKRNSRYSNLAKSMALYNMKQIRKIAANGRGNTLTKAHKEHLKLLIDKTLEAK